MTSSVASATIAKWAPPCRTSPSHRMIACGGTRPSSAHRRVRSAASDECSDDSVESGDSQRSGRLRPQWLWGRWSRSNSSDDSQTARSPLAIDGDNQETSELGPEQELSGPVVTVEFRTSKDRPLARATLYRDPYLLTAARLVAEADSISVVGVTGGPVAATVVGTGDATTVRRCLSGTTFTRPIVVVGSPVEG